MPIPFAIHKKFTTKNFKKSQLLKIAPNWTLWNHKVQWMPSLLIIQTKNAHLGPIIKVFWWLSWSWGVHLSNLNPKIQEQPFCSWWMTKKYHNLLKIDDFHPIFWVCFLSVCATFCSRKPLIEKLENILEKKVPNSKIIKDAFLVYLATPTNLLFICILAIKINLFRI